MTDMPLVAPGKEAISVAEFFEAIQQPNTLFLLDVRADTEFERWQIEARHTPETLNIFYASFFDEDEAEDAYGQVPLDRDIVVLCAKGGTSDLVAEELRNRGANAVNLDGGMIAWGNYYKFHTVKQGDNYAVHQVERPSRGCLSYVVVSGNEAAIIDPLRHTDVYDSFMSEHGLTVRLLLDTHAHADHISGGPALHKSTGAPYYLHPYDGIHPFDMLPPAEDFEFDMLSDGQVLQLGEVSIRVIHVPGHTLGQVNFLATTPDGEHFFFTGDNLFIQSFGRPDLGGQGERWAPIVHRTIFDVVRNTVPGDAWVLPGHFAQHKEADEATGLYAMRLNDLWVENSDLSFEDKDAFIDYVLNHLPTLPQQYIQIKRVNTGLVVPTEQEASELELGKNICALSDAY